MIDIHSHVIWGVDDGATTREDSLGMLQLAARTGTTDIVATPHCNAQYQFDQALRDARISDLMEATGGTPRIHGACDFRLNFDNIQAALAEPGKYTINGLRYLMVEFDDVLIPPSTEEIFRQLMEKEICPVITHPERNPILQSSFQRLENWKQMGCLLQVTASCLTGGFGKTAHDAAWKLLRQDLVHVVASDGHDVAHRPPRLDIARETLTREMGAEAADLLLVINPTAILAGEPVWGTAAISAGHRKKSRFAFWR